MPDYRRLARDFAEREGYPPDTFERLIDVESGYNPRAYNPKSGASGIAQLVPQWHPGVDPWNPVESLRYAARWLGNLYRAYGRDSFGLVKSLIAYNAGPSVAQSWSGNKRDLPRETQQYIDLILGEGERDSDGWWNTDIAGGIVSAIRESIASLLRELFGGGVDILIDRFAPPAMAVVGVALISVGLFAAAIRSAPARTATRIASVVPDARVQAVSGAVRIVQ